MALLGTFTKQPSEVLDFFIDYSTVLQGRTDIIVTKTVVVTPAGMTSPTSTINAGGTGISVVVAGGTTATNYLVTVTATSNATPTALVYQDEVEVEVLEVL